MEYIWAPWREKYVKKIHLMKECIFCKALSSNNDEKSFILLRGKYNFVILNTFPYNCGHLMIAPYSHLSSPEHSTEESLMEFFIIMNVSLNVLKEAYNPHGFNIGMNLGKSAGAGVVDHYHLHIVPRWEGDANFMPLFGKTKVLLEDLKTTYNRLSPLFKEKREKILNKK
ncbi:HIT domain-containing protein [Candidatus Aminicenantes bacterium AH-873-B07]|jgi:ATP adenylyltransferase|nr:HIT domain-containing protein [Candidatus Aminicenantes bacterium AH-873-B07]